MQTTIGSKFWRKESSSCPIILSLSVLFCLRNYVHAMSIITLIDIMLCVRVPLIVGNVSYVVWKCNFSLNIIIFCRIDTNCNNNDDFCFCRVESKSFFDFTNSNNSVEFKMEIGWKAIFTKILYIYLYIFIVFINIQIVTFIKIPTTSRIIIFLFRYPEKMCFVI